MIFLDCTAGLANRLRAMDSAVQLSKRIGHRLHVEWPRNSDCGAGYSELFRLAPDFVVEQPCWKLVATLIRSRRRSIRSIRGALGFGRSSLILHDDARSFFYPEEGSALSQGAVEKAMRCRIISVQTNHAWLYPHDFSWLQPHPKVEGEVCRTCRRFAGKTIGIQVRRGDFPESRQTPLANFCEAIDQRIDGLPEAMLFLSTDDAGVKESLTRRYRSRLVTRPIEPSRRSVAGLRDAVADLFCLAKCSEIIGSHGSSFCEVAHHIGKAPLIYPEYIPPANL